MSRAFIGIGSNDGDRLQAISRAVQFLGAPSGLRVVQLAPIQETAPVGGPPQGPYLNSVVELQTELPPHELLAALQRIEWLLGRRSSKQRWGPRPMDLDLLLYDDRIVQDPEMTIPHPRMHERRFVLEPLAQLAPDVIHPVLREPIRALLARLPAASSTPNTTAGDAGCP